MHLAKYSPARTLLVYSFDFMTLLLFATAIPYWPKRGRLFYLAIAFPTLFMIGRFWFAYSYKRQPWIPQRRRKLVTGGLGVLSVFLVILLSFTSSGWWPEVHNWLLLFCMVGGVVVTCFSLGQLNTFTLVHKVPLSRPNDQLVFLLPHSEPPLTATTMSEVSSIDHLALSKFEADVIKAPPACRYVHLSNVHSFPDTRVHSLILALPSIGFTKEIRQKCYLTYAAHWFDDLFDRNITSGRSIEGGGDYDLESLIGRNFHNIIGAIANTVPDHKCLGYALNRLRLGSLIFRNGTAMKKAAEDHLKEVRSLLSEDSPWTLREAVSEFVEKPENALFIHLTAKTVQELWFGCESKQHPFGYTLLFSILYGPALYYHNKEWEVTCKEMDEEMAAGRPPDQEEVSTMIMEVATLIASYDQDTRKPLRKIQILTVANSFQFVMDDQIRKAYVAAAAML